MKNPYFASRPGEVRDIAAANIDDIATETGGNTGNLLFFSALRKVIRHEKPSSGVNFDPNYIKENHDGIIIPAANWLTARRDMGNLSALIEKANVPTVLIGIGAQSFDNKIPELQPSTRRFLEVVSERSHSIAARGIFTAEVIANAGIKNVEVTGCPSLLWHLTKPASVSVPSTIDLSKVSINSTRYEARESDGKPSIGMRLARYAYQNELDFVVQTEFDLMRIARREAIDQNLISENASIFGAQNVVDLMSYISRRTKMFTDVPSWIEYNSSRSLIFGMRLHGVISALLAGKPALLVAHDSRTREMAVQAGIPFVESDALASKPLSIKELIEQINFNHFNNTQLKYFASYITYLNNNGISHNLKPVTV